MNIVVTMFYAGIVYACVVVSLYIVESTANSKHLRSEGFTPVVMRQPISSMLEKKTISNKMCYLTPQLNSFVNATSIAMKKKLFQRMK
jgi:hypothetical protein